MSEALSHAQLLQRLKILNRALERLGADPYVTETEAAILPRGNLADVVGATGDHLAEVTRGLAGTG